jgi:tetratricopeptide (TPR) repeat protein
MRIFGMRIASALAVCLMGSLGQAGRMMAQAAPAAAATVPAAAATDAMSGMASIHGHVNNAAGQTVTSADVKLTTDRNPNATNRKFAYTFALDASGNYKGTGIKPGNYVAVLVQGPKTLDYLPAPLAAGEDKTVDFDMTRKEYLDRMSTSEREALDAFKKQNAATVAANSKIENLNKLLTQARTDNKAGNFAAAIKSMTDATTAKPDEPILWATLGDAQLGDAEAANKAAKAIHATDVTVPDKYAAAVTSYQKAISLNAAAEKPNVEIASVADNQLGQALSRLGKTKDSATAYEAAAKADPKNAGMYYFNEAATLLNANDVDDAAAAADKVIAIDPNKADAYYIKGQALIQKLTIDEKTQKPVVPAGCVEAYQKYLTLAPTGVHAADVKGILEGIGQPIKSSYRAPKK